MQPAAQVVVTVAASGELEVTTPTSLTFSTTSWNSAQAVTVTAGGDLDGDDDTDAVTFTAASTDSDYQDFSDEVAVTVLDDDSAGFVFSVASLEIGEEDPAGGPSRWSWRCSRPRRWW